jgi:conjugal transfer ATP-binding protein TraC
MLFLKQTKKPTEKPNSLDWLGIKTVKNGVVVFNSSRYVKIMEVMPVNFLLSSKVEKSNIITAFRQLLNVCDFPIQILVKSWKADTRSHVKRMQGCRDRENDENCKELIDGYIKLLENIGGRNAVSRRFFIAFPYVPDPGVKDYTFSDVVKKLNENKRKILEYLKNCGNKVIETSDENISTAKVLYEMLNRKRCETQSFPENLENILSPAITGYIKT